MKIRVAISGAGGKMGRTLLKGVIGSEWFELSGAIESPKSDLVGLDVGELLSIDKVGVTVQSWLKNISQPFDVLIDFSTPEATLENLRTCVELAVPLVIGTTGFKKMDEEEISISSKKIPICMAANYSAALNLCFELAERATRVLGDDADIEIIEAHHREKVDSPSGTALALGKLIAEGLGRDFGEIAKYSRHGDSGSREPNTIGFSVIRAGDIVGEHKVIFALDGECIEISHRASSREAFSSGALRAASWVVGRSPALYSMRDVIAGGERIKK